MLRDDRTRRHKQRIHLPDDPKLITQLTSRRLKSAESTQGKIALQSKPEARAAGLPSPDRADSLVLCFWSFRPDFIGEILETPTLVEPLSYEEWIMAQKRQRYIGAPTTDTTGYTVLTGAAFQNDTNELN